MEFINDDHNHNTTLTLTTLASICMVSTKQYHKTLLSNQRNLEKSKTWPWNLNTINLRHCLRITNIASPNYNHSTWKEVIRIANMMLHISLEHDPSLHKFEEIMNLIGKHFNIQSTIKKHQHVPILYAHQHNLHTSVICMCILYQ